MWQINWMSQLLCSIPFFVRSSSESLHLCWYTINQYIYVAYLQQFFWLIKDYTIGWLLLHHASVLQGDLLSYAKSVSPVFWSISSRGTELPHSIKGKLGGPSQRRLASHTTSDVLQAVCAIWYILIVSGCMCNFLAKGYVTLILSHKALLVI